MNCKLTDRQVDRITGEFGSSVYVFHEEAFAVNYRALLEAFRAIYPKYNIAYSYKTNYTPCICAKVKELGGAAEVVSDMEYRLARRLGYNAGGIVYNGPVKGPGLYEHLLEGGAANIDNLDELRSVARFAGAHPEKTFRLAFRVNVDIGQDFVSRFGLDAYEFPREGAEIDEAVALVRAQPNLRIAGVHCHVGRSRSLEAWRNRVRVLFALIDRYFSDDELEFVDFGSGMNSVMEPSLAAQFGGHIPEYGEYAAILAGAMREKYGALPPEKQPVLYTEPGTTVVSGYLSFLSTVQSIKTVKGKTFVTFDGSGGNMGDICRLKQLPVSVFRRGQAPRMCRDAEFAGYTCLEHDEMYRGFCGEIAVGDVVQFRNVGSYSNVFKPPFIYPNCAMVRLKADGSVDCIKRAETFEDVFSTYIF